MAKDKKRGFFSWLGFGSQQNDEQATSTPSQLEENSQTESAAVSPAQQHETVPAEIKQGQNAKQPDEGQASAEAEEVTLPPKATRVEDSAVGTVDSAPPAQDAEVYPLSDAVKPIENIAVELPILPENQPGTVQQREENLLIDARVVGPERYQHQQEKSDEQQLEQRAEIARSEETAALEDTLQEEDVSSAMIHQQEKPSKEGFFVRLKRSLLKTKQNIGSGFFGLFRGKQIDDDLFEALEEQLLIADVGVETSRKIIDSLTEHATRKELKDAEALFDKLKEEMGAILANVDSPLRINDHHPFVILMVGVNGVGKTTTIGKLARQFQAQGKSVMLAAGDTFRAAAVEQLQVWGERNHIPVIAQHSGADSASVIFDAIQAAKSRHVDVLIADTAGRLQNKAYLMEELKKIVRVMKKLDMEAPHEVMLTLDASTGQNAISQAKLFHEAVGLTGITLTKLDGTAKGGVIFSVADRFGIPIRYIGVGEGIEDLRPFKASDFIEALFAQED